MSTPAKTALVITSIASDDSKVLQLFAQKSAEHNVEYIIIGDSKSPLEFEIDNCDYYSIQRQLELPYTLVKELPQKHYARKNLGYLIAIENGAEIIIETDDDNWPMDEFWEPRNRESSAHLLEVNQWVNVYKYFSNENIWPRGFSLPRIAEKLTELASIQTVSSPIQQGLADDNPDVDAIYRLVGNLPVKFHSHLAIALGNGSICPFNSQNTTWFREAFALLYLPSYCSFRMTDIWRSFIAQRIAWTCNWPVLFHNHTVWQERNEHSLMRDFQDEVEGYLNNELIMDELNKLPLKLGEIYIVENMTLCYQRLIELELIGKNELPLLKAWFADLRRLNLIN